MNRKNKAKIVIDPKILVGKPVIAGTRIPVYLVLNLLAHGYDFKRIMKRYPVLKKADVVAAIEYSENRLQREETYPLSLKRVLA